MSPRSTLQTERMPCTSKCVHFTPTRAVVVAVVLYTTAIDGSSGNAGEILEQLPVTAYLQFSFHTLLTETDKTKMKIMDSYIFVLQECRI